MQEIKQKKLHFILFCGLFTKSTLQICIYEKKVVPLRRKGLT